MNTVAVDTVVEQPADTGAFTVSDADRRYLLVLFTVIGIVAVTDRQIYSIVLQAIKLEFGFSDTQIGILGGLALGLVNATVGLPIAWLADKYNRRNMMAIATAVWSGMTALTGLATGFLTLFLARMGVGLGVTAGGPPSLSLISDYFPPQRRATALSILSVAFPLGALVGFLIGGWVTQYFGWRAALIIVGTPGLILAVILRLTLREPPRGLSENIEVAGPPPSLLPSIRYLLSRPAIRHIVIAGTLYGLAAWGAATWVPAYFMRVHGMSPGAVGTWLAFTIGGAGCIGTLLGGYVTDRVARSTGDTRWYMWISSGSILAAVPFAFVVYLWPTPIPALLAMIIPVTLAHMFLGPSGATLLGLAGVKRRATVTALNFLVMSVISITFGPLIVGVISDYYYAQHGDLSLRYSLLTLVVVANTWSALHYFLAARTLRVDLATADSG